MNLSERLVAFVVERGYNLGQLEELIGTGHGTLRKAIKSNRVNSEYLEKIFAVVGGTPKERYYVLFGEELKNVEPTTVYQPIEDPIHSMSHWMSQVDTQIEILKEQIRGLKELLKER